MNKERNEKLERLIMRYFAPLSWCFLAFACTMILYYFVEVNSKDELSKNIYLLGILAGSTGAIWGLIVQKAYDYFHWVKHVKDWYPPESFRMHLFVNFLITVFSFVSVYIISRFI